MCFTVCRTVYMCGFIDEYNEIHYKDDIIKYTKF